MHYKNSRAFEDLVLGRHDFGAFGYNLNSFDGSFRFIINKAVREGYKHPDTDVAKLLYHGVRNQLKKMGLDSSGLAFIPTTGTSADWSHKTDALFYLPLVPKFFIMVDLFNFDTEFSAKLRDLWEKDSPTYSEENFQSDLFVHKGGLSSFLKKSGEDTVSGWTRILNPRSDFWQYAPKENGTEERIKARKINHFVLIPEYIIYREKRKRFCRMIAECFQKRIRGIKI